MMNEIDNVYVTVTRDNTVEYPMHSHGFFEIMCYLSGSGVMRTEKGDIPFEKGTVICMPPHCMHGSCSEKGFKNISVGYVGFEFGSSTPIVFGAEQTELYELIDLIYRLYYKDVEKYAQTVLSLLNTVARLVTVERGMLDNSDDVSALLKNRMLYSFTDCAFSLTELIKQLPYTDDYVRKCFKRSQGTTPLRYLTNLRLSHADNLLRRSPNEKISDIARASGFSDPLYFSRAYKKRYGVSPQKRKDMISNEENKGL